MHDVRGRRSATLGVVAIVAALALPRPALAQAAAEALPAERAALFVRDDGGGWVPVPLVGTEVSIRVTGPIVRARVVQRFANPTDRWLEGVYVFPLPAQAAVDRMRLMVGDRVLEGQVQEKAQARETYERARRDGRRASLVEQSRPNVFTTAVANLGPGETAEVEIEYQEVLRLADGRYRMRFPTVVAPRFEPGATAWGPPPAASGPGLLRISDPPVAQPPVRHPADGPVQPIRFEVFLDPGFPLSSVESPSHAVFVEPLAGGVQRVLSRDVADRDFVLDWVPAAGAAPRVAIFAEPLDGEVYVLLVVLPPSPSTTTDLSREVVFVVDTSGSMGGPALDQARRALLQALDGLEARDAFNVIRFDSHTRPLYETSQPADARRLKEARDWVRGLRARGGTHMLPALRRAFETDRGLGDVRQVVFLTDGSVGTEAALFGLIESDLGRSRLFSVGVGTAPNGHLLTRAARHGRGTHTFIASPEEVAARMGALLRKLERPVLGDVRVGWNAPAEAWPAQIPDLYAEEPLVLTARLPHTGGAVTLEGRLGALPWRASFPLEPAEGRRGIAALWARRKIAALMEGLATGADRERVRAAVVEVALRHHLVSTYTSLVAVDVTPVRPSREGLASSDVPANLPAGWNAEAVGTLPRTATPGALLRGLGLAVLVAAAGLARRGRRAA